MINIVILRREAPKDLNFEILRCAQNDELKRKK